MMDVTLRMKEIALKTSLNRGASKRVGKVTKITGT